MNEAVAKMLERYRCRTEADYKNALIEIMQEVALLGLWRAKFFEHAAFYGGTSLRILYHLDRFSEDLDFSLLKPQPKFDLNPYLNAVQAELHGMGFNVSVETRKKKDRDCDRIGLHQDRHQRVTFEDRCSKRNLAEIAAQCGS